MEALLKVVLPIQDHPPSRDCALFGKQPFEDQNHGERKRKPRYVLMSMNKETFNPNSFLDDRVACTKTLVPWTTKASIPFVCTTDVLLRLMVETGCSATKRKECTTGSFRSIKTNTQRDRRRLQLRSSPGCPLHYRVSDTAELCQLGARKRVSSTRNRTLPHRRSDCRCCQPDRSSRRPQC